MIASGWAMIPVVNTFIHFSRRGNLARCRSAPAEVWVDWVVAEALARERIGERRRERKSKTIRKKWARLVEGGWELQAREAMEVVRDLLAQHLSRTTPRLR